MTILHGKQCRPSGAGAEPLENQSLSAEARGRFTKYCTVQYRTYCTISAVLCDYDTVLFRAEGRLLFLTEALGIQSATITLFDSASFTSASYPTKASCNGVLSATYPTASPASKCGSAVALAGTHVLPSGTKPPSPPARARHVGGGTLWWPSRGGGFGIPRNGGAKPLRREAATPSNT